MRRLLRKLDTSAGASVARAEFSSREVLLLCGVAVLWCGFLTFASTRALADPKADRSLVYCLFGMVGCFWLGTASLWTWAVRWRAHWRNRNTTPGLIEPARTALASESRQLAVGDELLLTWSQRSQLGWRDLLALGSFLLLEAVLVLGAGWIVVGLVPHLNPDQPLTLPKDYPILACLLAALVGATLAGKYLWLWVMARWLSPAEIAPILGYGIPRRLSRFDQHLLERIARR